jgi:hypothetical protein
MLRIHDCGNFAAIRNVWFSDESGRSTKQFRLKEKKGAAGLHAQKKDEGEASATGREVVRPSVADFTRDMR